MLVRAASHQRGADAILNFVLESGRTRSAPLIIAESTHRYVP